MPLLSAGIKNLLSILIVAFFVCFLFACASSPKSINPYRNIDLTIERWPMQLVRTPERWKVGVDSFFINGEPTPIELANRSAAFTDAAISTMMVQAP